MEEKTKKAKVQSLEKKQDKLTYEQLEQVAGNLNQQCQKLYSQLQEARNMLNGFQVVDLLLTILKQGEHFSDSFLDKCVSKVEEIVSLLFVPVPQEDKDSNTEKLN
jgi:hypothetical protein